ncbi:MAG TPA: HDOD domain-containing protein [Thiobacillaceae bacterium]|nr:HDOD domain-containing protein [Thiobacillaceae bacterium]HNU64702.1 HDOD domain-containing protein [Thiobacillaceae bacterium]
MQTTHDSRARAPLTQAAPAGKDLEILQRFLTRQPVLDRGDHVIGYELKRRDRAPLEVLPGALSFQQAQDEHLLVSAIDLDHRKALGEKLIFLGVAPETLLNPLVEQLPSKRVVLALRPHADLDPVIIDRALALTRKGLMLALDDAPHVAATNPLMSVCRFVRLDIHQYDVMALAERMAGLQRGPRHELIATQVDTQEAFETGIKLGFDLLQGYYFTQLEPSKPGRLDTSVLRVMDLLNKIMDGVEINVLEATFKLDPALTYKLLRYINSPAIGLRVTIQSIGHALALLGYEQTYRWLTLLLFSSVRTSARNQALLRNALARAYFTEALGRERMDASRRGGLFITGVFSQLDALLNIPMSQALANLNLPHTVIDALLHGDGPYAPYLKLVIACERFDQEAIAALAGGLGLDAEGVNLAHVNALIWSESVEV